VQEVIKDVVADKDRVCGLATPTHDSDSGHEMVSPFFDDV